MGKKYKRGNVVTGSVEYVQSLIGKNVAVREGDCVVCGEISGIQLYLGCRGLQGVKVHLKGFCGFYHLDDVICIL